MINLSFDDGREDYRLNERCTIRMNLSDPGFLERIAGSFETLDALQSSIGEGDDEGVYERAKEADRQIRTELDQLFGEETSEKLFGGANVCASAGGFPIWANLLLAVTEEAERRMADERKARDARIAKYVEKYKKP